MQRHSLLLSAIAAIVALSTPAALRADTPAPLEIPVIASLTGGAAFIGKAGQQSLELLEAYVNKHGGVNHQPLHFHYYDDGSSAQTGVQLANQAIATKAALIIGPTLTQQCNAVAPFVLANGPVDYCLSPGVPAPPHSYIFSASVSVRDCVFATVKYFRARGLTRLAILSSTDATGQEADRDLEAARALPENQHVEFVAREQFNLSDVSVSAQLARIKAAKPQALITWTVGPAFGTELHGIADSGLDVPVMASSGNMVMAQLSQYKSFMPKELLFTAVLPQAHDSIGSGPVKDAQRVFFDVYKAAGEKPDFVNTLAWDPALIAIDAFQHLGNSAPASQIRDYISNLHGFAGINGIYDFRDGGQHGVGMNSIIVVRWDAATSDYVPVSKRGGSIK